MRPRPLGTAGTAAALIFLALLKPSTPLFLLITVVSVVLGTIASEMAEKELGEKDSGHIVIDEVAGYFIAMLFLPQTFGYFVAAFVLFRVLDVLKPPPIRGLQYLHGGVGVMADDIAAGIIANIAIQIWRFLI